MVGGDDPSGIIRAPTDFAYLGLEAGIAVEVVPLGDALTMGKDLGPLRVLLGRDVTQLLEQRDVDVGLDVAGDARIAVPVPGSADVGGLVDQAQALDAELAQPRPREQPTEAGSDDRHVHLVVQRRPREVRIGPGIVGESPERAVDLDVLRHPVGAQTSSPLLGVALAQRFWIELTRRIGHDDTPFRR